MLSVHEDITGAYRNWIGAIEGVTVYDPAIVFGIVDENEIRGAFYFNSFNGFNTELSFFGKNCLTRPIIRFIAVYAFEELKVLRLTAKTKRSNKIVCRILPRIGFDYEATLKQFFGPTRQDDAIVFRITHMIASRWM